MRSTNRAARRSLLGPSVVLALSALLALAFTAPSSGAGRPTASDVARARPTITLNSVGTRFVGARIPIKGYNWGVPRGRNRVALQRFSTARHRWSTRAVKYVPTGTYRFPARHAGRPGWVRFRTVLYLDGRRAAVSDVIRVHILPAPVPTPPAAGRPPVACAVNPDPATCVKPVRQQPAGAALPDLRIKDLTRCGAGDMAATNNTCFKIDHPVDGPKLLKFAVITLNVGAGPAEIVAHRASTVATRWTAYQNFYDGSGRLLGSMLDPNLQFFYALDGHNHWHITDFDEYDLLDARGTTLRRGEKHGYCIQDNTTYTPMQGMAGVATAPTYAEATSCGKGQPAALSIVHGLSRGWGDTYPTSLPNQAIDITGLPDGEYTVRVHADAVGAVRESDETDNVAEVKVEITGDAVTVVPGSSVGGLR